MVWYSSLSSLCNKLSYCASQSPTGFDQPKSEIEKLMIQMEGLSNIVGEGNNFEKMKALLHYMFETQISSRPKEIQGNSYQTFRKQDGVVDVKKLATLYESMNNWWTQLPMIRTWYEILFIPLLRKKN